MADLTLRNVKGSPLTNQEVDDNFSNLNTDKWSQDNTKISNWDAAYGWGDHAAVGYLTTLSLDGLTDVSVSGATNGQSLVYNSTSGEWEASTPASTLGSLTDVSIAGVTDGQALVYNSTSGEWEAGASSSTTVSTTAPVSPSAGDLWWNSESGQLKVYYIDVDGAQWVDAAAGPTTQTVTLSFPFYDSDTTLDSIALVSNQNLPFFKADGTQDNITVTT